MVGAEFRRVDHVSDPIAQDGKRTYPNAHVRTENTAGAQSLAEGDIGNRGHIVIAEKQVLRGIEEPDNLAALG